MPAPAGWSRALGGDPDVVLSDMAAPTTGHRRTDHIRTMHLAEVAADFALSVLRPGGHFLAKAFQGGTENELLDLLKRISARSTTSSRRPRATNRSSSICWRRISRAGRRSRTDAEQSHSVEAATYLGGACRASSVLPPAGGLPWPDTELPASGASRRNGNGRERRHRRDDHEGGRERPAAPSGCAGEVGETFEDHAGQRDAERHADLLRHRRDRASPGWRPCPSMSAEHQRVGRR